MKLRSCQIYNILSIGKIELEFGDSGLVLLDGWNYDDDSANGAGKTAIFNSIAFGLYGKFPRKITASNILRNGTKVGHVKLILEVDGETVEVFRQRPNILQFKIDGQDKIMTQEEFEKKIKLSYDQFLISAYSAQTEGLKLISLPDTEKKDFFLQLINLDHFSDYKKHIDSILKALATKLAEANVTLAKQESKMSAYREAVIDVDELNEKIRQENPASLIKKMKELSGVQAPDVSKYDALEVAINKEIKNILKQQTTIELKRKEHKKLLANLKTLTDKPAVLINSMTCPHCDGQFSCTEDGHSVTLETLKIQRQNDIAELKDLITQVVTEINESPDFDNITEQLQEKLQKIRAKKASEYQDYQAIREQISDLKAKISVRNTRIEQYRASIDSNNQVLEKMSALEKEIENSRNMVNSITDDISLHETISAIFSPTGAPAYVLDSIIESFNEKISGYVSEIWQNASYQILSFKENKSGDVKAKFSELLKVNGKERSIGALSGGEHRCLSLAIDFAVIDVLESLCGISINPIMLDEPFNDLDASNRERVVELLEKMAVSRQIWVIDHASEAKSMFTNIVKVEKRDGVTSL